MNKTRGKEVYKGCVRDDNVGVHEEKKKNRGTDEDKVPLHLSLGIAGDNELQQSSLAASSSSAHKRKVRDFDLNLMPDEGMQEDDAKSNGKQDQTVDLLSSVGNVTSDCGSVAVHPPPAAAHTNAVANYNSSNSPATVRAARVENARHRALRMRPMGPSEFVLPQPALTSNHNVAGYERGPPAWPHPFSRPTASHVGAPHVPFMGHQFRPPGWPNFGRSFWRAGMQSPHTAHRPVPLPQHSLPPNHRPHFPPQFGPFDPANYRNYNGASHSNARSDSSDASSTQRQN